MATEYSKAVKNIAWYIILVSYHFNIGIIDVLPDWLGYILLYNAVKTIGKIQPSANLLKTFSAVLIADSLFQMICKIFDFSIQSYVYGVIMAIIHIYLDFQILTDIWHTAQKYRIYSGNKIPMLRNITTFTYTVSFVFLYSDWNVYVTYGAAVINIIMKTYLAFILFIHADDEKLKNITL
ncbi:MAG: hypothetical protein IKY90_05715 [Oscillospiraceae bacterium]|nr:hypothetical protein [Oscillospiraceae bacterium]